MAVPKRRAASADLDDLNGKVERVRQLLLRIRKKVRDEKTLSSTEKEVLTLLGDVWKKTFPSDDN